MAKLRLQEAAAAKVQAAAAAEATKQAKFQEVADATFRASTEADAAAAKQRAADIKSAGVYWDEWSRKVKADSREASTAFEDASRTIGGYLKNWYTTEVQLTAQTVASIAGSFASLEDSIVQGYQNRIDAGERLSKAQVQQANRALVASEAAQIAQAGITSAITAASGIASLQTSGVPPFAAIPLGVAEGAGLFAATVAGIRSHRPISFSWNSGGAPTWTPPGGTATNDQLATGASLVGEKGGTVTTGEDAPTGGAVRHGGSSTQRSGRDGTKVEVKVTPGRVGKFPKRGGRA
jgi:phage gp36-like protein